MTDCHQLFIIMYDYRDHCIFCICITAAVSETVTMETTATVEASAPTQAEPTQSHWPDFDQKVSELEDWLTLLSRMLKSCRVVVADIPDIEEASFKHKVGTDCLFRVHVTQIKCQ